MNKILEKYINNEAGTAFSSYNLEGITMLLDKLGNPQNSFKSVHVAGTNGKGSTCFMTSRILEGAGYSTGLFISPHLSRLNERISINSSDIPDEVLYNYLLKLDDIICRQNIRITYFDLLTATAFNYFADMKVDIAVIETGLGGRLDSTNIIKPLISVITDISMDHSHILGNSIGEITEEKCGIIKPGIPVVTSNTDPHISKIINDFADKNHSRVFSLSTDFFTDEISFSKDISAYNYSFDDGIPLNIEIPLPLEHQVKNSSIAVTVCRLLKRKGYYRITDENIISSLKNIIIPGRFQIICENPLVIYDPAHNIASLTSLLKGIDALYPGYRVKIILTMMQDKVTDDILKIIKERNRDIVYYSIDDTRAYVPENNLFSLITGDKFVILEYIQTEKNSNTLFLFTGTFRIFTSVLSIGEIINNYSKHGK